MGRRRTRIDSSGWLRWFSAWTRHHLQRRVPVRIRSSHWARCFPWVTMWARSRMTRCRFCPCRCEKKLGAIGTSADCSITCRARRVRSWIMPFLSRISRGTCGETSDSNGCDEERLMRRCSISRRTKKAIARVSFFRAFREDSSSCTSRVKWRESPSSTFTYRSKKSSRTEKSSSSIRKETSSGPSTWETRLASSDG